MNQLHAWLVHASSVCEDEVPRTWGGGGHALGFIVELQCESRAHVVWRTGIVLHKLLECVKLGSGGDVVAAVVQLADLVVFDVVPLHLVPIPYGQGERSWGPEQK